MQYLCVSCKVLFILNQCKNAFSQNESQKILIIHLLEETLYYIFSVRLL